MGLKLFLIFSLALKVLGRYLLKKFRSFGCFGYPWRVGIFSFPMVLGFMFLDFLDASVLTKGLGFRNFVAVLSLRFGLCCRRPSLAVGVSQAQGWADRV